MAKKITKMVKLQVPAGKATELCKRGYFECCGKSSDACRSEGSHAFSFCGNSSGCGGQGMHGPAYFNRTGRKNCGISERILYRE